MKKNDLFKRNIMFAVKSFVNNNNSNRYGRQLFQARVTPKVVLHCHQKLCHAKNEQRKFEVRFPNIYVSNYPKTKHIKLDHNSRTALHEYKKNKRILSDRNRIIKSVANAYVQRFINKDLAKKIIAIFDGLDRRHKDQYLKQFNTDVQMLQNNPGDRSTCQPLSEALQLYKLYSSNANSIGSQFHSILGRAADKNDKASLPTIFRKIKLIYSPALLKISKRGDVNKVVIFNPLKGFWTHSYDTLAELARTIKPTLSHKNIITLMESLASDAGSRHRYIIPYHGSRYLLYKNGAYDALQQDNSKTKLPDQLIPLNSSFVYDLHFTDRDYHQINFRVNPKLPGYDKLEDKTGQPHALWTPLRMLNGYANFDSHIRDYFLFCLSLGLFSSHNFGVSLDIQGPSGFGKTVLSTIFATIYGPERVYMAPFSNLNGRFVFTSYNDDTAVIWFNEANTGSKPLGSRGISTYDSLNDDQARFEVKNKNDHIIDNPPMVFLDGTDFLHTVNPTVGPYRRTLVMMLPSNMKKKKKKTFYTSDLKDLIGRSDVVEWLNWHMLMAFRLFIKKCRLNAIDDFRINLLDSNILRNLPQKARDWRQNLLNRNTNLIEWFTEVLQPCLLSNPNNLRQFNSRVQKAFMYHLFGHHMITNYHEDISRTMDVNTFWNDFKAVADEYGWELVRMKSGNQPRNKSRFSIKKLSSTHISFDKYQERETLPPDYRSSTIRKQPFGFSNAWYYIIRKSNNDKDNH